MKGNRILLLAAAAAMAAPGLVATPAAQVGVQQVNVASGSMQAPQGGIGALLQAIGHARGGNAGAGIDKPRHKRHGHTVAQGKRMAAKRRNRLRARGQYRRAVR